MEEYIGHSDIVIIFFDKKNWFHVHSFITNVMFGDMHVAIMWEVLYVKHLNNFLCDIIFLTSQWANW